MRSKTTFLRKSAHLLFAVWAAFVGAAPVAWAQPLTKVTVVQSHTDPTMDAEVFLYVVPKHMGFFEQEKLEVASLFAQGDAAAAQVMLSGRAQFATLLAENLLRVREQGADAVAFFQLKRNNGFAVGVLPSSKVRQLGDLAGKKLGLPVAKTALELTVSKQLRSIGVNSFDTVGLGFGPAAVAVALQAQRVDAVVYWDGAFASMENNGVALRYLQLPILDTLAGYALTASSSLLRDKPELAARYCRAISKGFVFANANPEAAVRMFYKEYPAAVPHDKPLDAAIKDGVHVLKRWMANAVEAPDAPIGALDPSRWEASRRLFVEFGMLKGEKSAQDAFTTKFQDECNAFDRNAIAKAAETYLPR